MIRATTHRTWELQNVYQRLNPDGTPGKMVTRPFDIPPGVHDLRRIDNPFGYKNAPWLVLANMPDVGMSEGAWNDWLQGTPNDRDGSPIDWGDWAIDVEYTGGDALCIPARIEAIRAKVKPLPAKEEATR